MWMGAPNGGLVAAAYGPSEVHTRAGGADLTVVEDTAYPFSGSIKMTVSVSKPARFPLVLRIPEWATTLTVRVNGTAAQSNSDAGAPDGFFSLLRDWRSGDVVTVDFPIEPRVTHWFHNAAVFEAGPLVFSLPLNGHWTELKHYAEKSGDWQIDSSKPWNYAVQVGECDATLQHHTISDVPFDAEHPAASLQIEGRRLPQWKEEENSAGPLPVSPVSSTAPLQSLTLVPYGAAKVRVTAFPFLDSVSRCNSPGSTHAGR
jgi:hypothetical protein